MKNFEELLDEKIKHIIEVTDDSMHGYRFAQGARWAHSLTGWRKYPEEKPEENTAVIAIIENKITGTKRVYIGFFLKFMFLVSPDEKVIAWMPIPEPFEETK